MYSDDRLGVVGLVADRHVLAGLEGEVAAAHAHDDRSVDARRPDDRPLDDVAQVVEQRVAAVLGGFHDARVVLAPERQPVGPGDAVAQQQLDGARDAARVVVEGLAAHDRLVRRARRDALDAGLRPGVEDGRVLGVDDALRRGVQRREVDVLGAAIARAQLLARDLEARAQLDQRQHHAAVGLDAFQLARRSRARRARGSSPTAPSRAARRSRPAGGWPARAAAARAPPRRSASSRPR